MESVLGGMWDPPVHPWEIRREATLDMLGKAKPFAMTAALQINQGDARLLLEAPSGRWSFERDRRDQRGVWHYVAMPFHSVLIESPGAAPAGAPPRVHSEFNVLQSPVDINPRFGPRFR